MDKVSFYTDVIVTQMMAECHVGYDQLVLQSYGRNSHLGLVGIERVEMCEDVMEGIRTHLFPLVP